MATPITAVQGSRISHALFIDLTLGNVTYYISSAYQPITIDSNTYTELGAFLQIGDVTEDLKTTNIFLSSCNVVIYTASSNHAWLGILRKLSWVAWYAKVLAPKKIITKREIYSI